MKRISRRVNLSDGDILVADRAYTDFGFLCELALRGVFFVVRQKRNMKMRVVRCAVWVRRELFAVLALMGRERGTAGAGKTTGQSTGPLISQGFLDFPQQNLGQQAA